MSDENEQQDEWVFHGKKKDEADWNDLTWCKDTRQVSNFLIVCFSETKGLIYNF